MDYLVRIQHIPIHFQMSQATNKIQSIPFDNFLLQGIFNDLRSLNIEWFNYKSSFHWRSIATVSLFSQLFKMTIMISKLSKIII